MGSQKSGAAAREPDQEHQLTIEHIHLDGLRPDPFNPRRISDTELDALTKSIQQFGPVDGEDAGASLSARRRRPSGERVPGRVVGEVGNAGPGGVHEGRAGQISAGLALRSGAGRFARLVAGFRGGS
jgi:hypothetical protein